MQKLQLDVSKWMGMAALLCETAGWWPLATLYTNMAQVAAAGKCGAAARMKARSWKSAGRLNAVHSYGSAGEAQSVVFEL